MARVREHGDEELYNKLDHAYPTEDEDSEVSSFYPLRNFHRKQSAANSCMIIICTNFEHQQDEEGEGGDETELETYDSSNDLSDEIDELTNDHHSESFAFDSEEDTSETEHVLT